MVGAPIRVSCPELLGLLGQFVCHCTVLADISHRLRRISPDLFQPPKLSGGEPA